MALILNSEIEGPIESNSVHTSGSGVILRSCGVFIRFTPSNLAHDPIKKITTPAGHITPAQLADVTPLPGRAEKGFEGGTVIAKGTFDTVTKEFNAESLVVEPAETVMLGALTQVLIGNPGALAITINHTPVSMLKDARMPSNPEDPATPIFYNQYMLPIKIESATLSGNADDPTSVEGYFANARFYAFLFQYGGTGTLLIDPAATPQISIERAQYRADGATFRLEARGWATTTHILNGDAPDVEIFRRDYEVINGVEVMHETRLDRVDTDQVEPGIDRWRAEFRGNIGGAAYLRQPPYEIFVKYLNGNNALAEIEPDLRLD